MAGDFNLNYLSATCVVNSRKGGPWDLDPDKVAETVHPLTEEAGEIAARVYAWFCQKADPEIAVEWEGKTITLAEAQAGMQDVIRAIADHELTANRNERPLTEE
jgi:hypothetical protein